MERRDFMSSVAALAATRWENEGYDPEKIEEWEELQGGTSDTGSFTPTTLRTSGHCELADWVIPDEDLDDRIVNVFYDTTDVSLCFEGTSGDIRGGGLVQFSPEQARQLGAALYQAGEELERRQGVEDGDD